MASEAFNFIAVIICYKRDALMLKKKLTQTPVGADSSAFGGGSHVRIIELMCMNSALDSISFSANNHTHSI